MAIDRGDLERISLTLHQDSIDAESWWLRYRSNIARAVTPTALGVIESDSRYIANASLASDPLVPRAPAGGRLRRGLVMGAVQSGKTASMMGVSAIALDSGVDILLLLAGTRTSLWRQTYDRYLRQLDVLPSSETSARSRLLVPSPSVAADDDARLDQVYAVSTSVFRRSIARRRPVVIVAMKQTDHLRALRRVLQRCLDSIADPDRVMRLLIIDDEADDGSVLDARVEASLDPTLDDLKQIPRSISDLWTAHAGGQSSVDPRLDTTYLAYTATPQANFLQSEVNPLAPRDFVAALRIPGSDGQLRPRARTFFEPSGASYYYTGADHFYQGGSQSPVVLTDALIQPPIIEGVRAFLAAAAMRIVLAPDRRSPRRLRDESFETRSEAESVSHPVSSMLVHTSAAISQHFDDAAQILAWGRGLSREEAQVALRAGARTIAAEIVQQDQIDNRACWVQWIDSYREHGARIHRTGLPDAGTLHEQVLKAIMDEVIPVLRISVVNTDDDADDPPAFAPTQDAAGRWHPPRDVCTIFVAGNVMSRGLTLEGLLTTVFGRASGVPLADSQMQNQRWFGYRGKYIEYCRILMSRQQLELFTQYANEDDALRQDILTQMNRSGDGLVRPSVLQGPSHRATGKIANIASIPLFPGPAPFVKYMNPGQEPDPNARHVSKIFEAGSTVVSVRGSSRGRILNEPLSLVKTAELLEGLTYQDPRGWSTAAEAIRWQSIERELSLPGQATPDSPFYRAPETRDGDGGSGFPPGANPYAIAAYLRVWNTVLTRPAPGLFPVNNPMIRWSMLPIAQRLAQQPVFYVGIRFGSGDSTSVAMDSVPDLRPMNRSVSENSVDGSWGSRGDTGADGYLGDQWFDYHFHGLVRAQAGRSAWRTAGQPGLILFHPIHRGDANHLTVAVGAVVPAGGPDQFAAVP